MVERRVLERYDEELRREERYLFSRLGGRRRAPRGERLDVQRRLDFVKRELVRLDELLTTDGADCGASGH